MTFTPEQLERAKRQSMKLLALAREGIGGEREKAGNLLATLMEKYGLKESDLILEGEATWHTWTPADRWDHELLIQCVGSVTNTKAVPNGRKGKKRAFKLTAFQHAEVDLLFIVHKQAWRKQQRQLFIAYISTNGLYIRDDAPARPATAKEWEDQQAIQRKMARMEPTPVPRGLLPSTAPRPQPDAVDTDVSWAGSWD